MAVYTTIDNPELYFQVKTYTGNVSTQSITFDGSEDMQPDLLWVKGRSVSESHYVQDAVRGVTKHLHTTNTDAEVTDTGVVTALNSNGFSLGDEGDVNSSSGTFVAWGWKANGSGSSNTDGTINTTKTSANTTAGFSINTFEGTGANATVGHGLGAAPTVLIVKKISQGANWGIGSVHIDNWTDYLTFTNLATSDDANFWQDTAPTSTVFSIGASGNINTDDEDHVAYCFTPIQGFSRFGKFLGTGSANGSFVYLGFRPAWVVIKKQNSSGSVNWYVFDNKRSPINAVDDFLKVDTSDAEGGDGNGYLDFLSNGFKLKTSNIGTESGGIFFYMAFAEQPFVNSNGVPCNAR